MIEAAAGPSAIEGVAVIVVATVAIKAAVPGEEGREDINQTDV
jgi:hypothetical protein